MKFVLIVVAVLGVVFQAYGKPTEIEIADDPEDDAKDGDSAESSEAESGSGSGADEDGSGSSSSSSEEGGGTTTVASVVARKRREIIANAFAGVQAFLDVHEIMAGAFQNGYHLHI